MLSTRIRQSVVPMLVLAMSLLCPRGVFAAIRTVTDLGDTTPGGAPGQLRFEINAAAAGDTIVIPAGTIVLTGGAGEDANASGDLDITKNLTIQGAGAGATIIDGGGIDRVFQIFGVTVTISGMTIRHGNAGAGGLGGGLLNEGTLTLTNVTVSGNTAGAAAGGVGSTGTLTITNVTVSGNTAGAAAGGVGSTGTLTITNSTLSGNTAGDGAGGVGSTGTLTITNSTLSGNVVGGSGGGVGSGGGTLTITNVTVSGNTAGAYGGGVDSTGTLTITNVTVSGNSANRGGGIATEGTATLTNSTVSDNSAANEGGGLLHIDGILSLNNGTVTNNVSDSDDIGGGNGGGIHIFQEATLNVKNTIIAGNERRATGSLPDDCFGTLTSQGFNLVGNSTGCNVSGAAGDLIGTGATPINPQLAPLANNGGPTATHALLPGSPAIDGGDNTGCPPIDQRGFVRTVDGDTNGSATCDIGAFELGPAIAAALAASVLPSGRSVQVGAPATVFATILNAGPGTALGCRIAPVPSLPATVTYQTTDPATNALTGSPNTPVDIPPGGGQSFVFALTPTSPIAPMDVLLSFACTNTAPAPALVGVSTLFLVAAATPVPDPVALAAVGPPNDGILRLASAGAFAMATVNVGASALLTVTPDTGGASLPLTLSICQTNPTTAACLAPPAASVTTQIDAGATPTFSIFADATAPIPFLPGTNRIFVRFTDQGGVTRGATSVAVCTVPLCS